MVSGFQTVYGTCVAKIMPTRPTPAHIACFENTAYGELPTLACVTAEAESTMTRPKTTNTRTTLAIT